MEEEEGITQTVAGIEFIDDGNLLLEIEVVEVDDGDNIWYETYEFVMDERSDYIND